MASWNHLPTELQLIIFDVLFKDGCSLANCAAVSRDWQAVIEPHNFARIKVTPSRLSDFGPMTHRNQSLVKYIWFCTGLKESYLVPPEHPDDEVDDVHPATAFESLFSTLSTWGPSCELLLDISVYQRQDSKKHFSYLTLEPDHPRSGLDGDERGKQVVPVSAPTMLAIDNVFDIIFADSALYGMTWWWQHLPLVPAVTGVLLRQQTRRRWDPTILYQMFSRFPRLREIHYEPWREWSDDVQEATDECYEHFLRLTTSSTLKKLVVFENFNQQYTSVMRCEPIRTPTLGVSLELARASLNLEALSASFIADASYFFDSYETSWIWTDLVSLTLTCQLLTPTESPARINKMLKAAAAAAMKMPKLAAMEIWNGRIGLVALFRYQSNPGFITWRGTWDLTIEPSVVQAWEAVAPRYAWRDITLVKELLDEKSIKSHGDAIYHLKHSQPVVRSVSLQQIQKEQMVLRELDFTRRPNV